MRKQDIKPFTEEVTKQVIEGVKEVREDLNISVLYPEYIDFDIDINGERVSYRVLTK